MYYPYFRGRRSELLALRDTAPTLAVKRKITPIIEPVSLNINDLQAFLATVHNKYPHAVITNPAVGELVGHGAAIERLIAPYCGAPGNLTIPGFHVGPTSTQSDVSQFLSKYGAQATVIVFDNPNPNLQRTAAALTTASVRPVAAFIDGRVSPSFIQSVGALSRVLIRDGFIAQVKNADYPPSDFFGNLHQTYQASGYSGFGDFTIVGDEFSSRGGPAHAVAIHLTELKPNREIYANHFVSNRTQGSVDTPGKFMEALDKLVSYVHTKRRLFAFSQACREFEALHSSQHFPGLASVKRLSIRHHLELIESII